MNSKFFNVSIKASKLNQQHVRLALAVGSLVLFVLGAGAPFGGGN